MKFADAPTLTTPRLTLRGWREADLAPFAALNADPRVLEYLPKALTRDESDAMVGRIQEGFAERGFGLWALEVTDGHEPASFAGFVGLSVPRFEAPFTPCVEIGWRLAASSWGHGYATEAASTALDFGFRVQELEEIVSFTVPANLKSRAVMERLGMPRDPTDDFEHPLLAEGHLLRHHVLYRRRAKAAS